MRISVIISSERRVLSTSRNGFREGFASLPTPALLRFLCPLLAGFLDAVGDMDRPRPRWHTKLRTCSQFQRVDEFVYVFDAFESSNRARHIATPDHAIRFALQIFLEPAATFLDLFGTQRVNRWLAEQWIAAHCEPPGAGLPGNL